MNIAKNKSKGLNASVLCSPRPVSQPTRFTPQRRWSHGPSSPSQGIVLLTLAIGRFIGSWPVPQLIGLTYPPPEHWAGRESKSETDAPRPSARCSLMLVDAVPGVSGALSVMFKLVGGRSGVWVALCPLLLWPSVSPSSGVSRYPLLSHAEGTPDAPADPFPNPPEASEPPGLASPGDDGLGGPGFPTDPGAEGGPRPVPASPSCFLS